ncbi:AcrR family transcriptional regulator [Kibdelosporangium banguiense]|uniref:AcrR family transcriptional regulator n=1 Tax=Kibdelosporangium banguiense TaxID=1365924 RepID=A0ABS4T7T9_9PSEU|nr:QsdR family transcriptional regulator [Kibdelosporangium banguiense]MBP2319928.1 AcrR family transcriptional regulator [Kibdelosporangium banguiense]
MSTTPLTRALRGPSPAPRSAPIDAFRMARKWFLDGKRVDMQQLAAELGVSRATLYRWCGSRELLIGEVIWSINERSLGETRAKTRGTGRVLFTRTLQRSLAQIRDFPALRQFVAEDAEYALRIITSKQSVVQARLIEWTADFLRTEVGLRPDIDVTDLAYVIVRVCESFVWSDMITGAPPETDKAVKIVDMLISAAEISDK